MNSSSNSKRAASQRKVLPRLLPANLATQHSEGSSHDGEVILMPKRPRIGVPIACNHCRLKKTRCDGGTPSCTPCMKKQQECLYEKANAKDAKGADLLVEAFDLLNTLNPAQATAVILGVRDKEGPTEMIEAVRQAANDATRASETDGGVIGSQSPFKRQLEANHPFMYPLTENISSEDANQLVRQLTVPRGAETQGPRNTDPVLPSTHLKGEPKPLPPAPQLPELDPGLNNLDISKWTTVPVSNELAIRALSLYLLTDHPLLSPFHRHQFAEALMAETSESSTFCSAGMVNSLMYWCCQMYASIDVQAIVVAEQFRLEALRLVAIEESEPTPVVMVAAMFLSLGHLAQGKDHATLRHLTQAVEIGAKLKLFGVPVEAGKKKLQKLTQEEQDDLAYPTWGVFNWVILMSLFYRQKGLAYPEYPPVLPIPSAEGTSQADAEQHYTEADAGCQLPSLSYAGDTFAALCQFWQLMHEVATKYYDVGTALMRDSITLQFAEFKYRELLAWADGLPMTLARSGHCPHFVMILHLWLHSAVLDIFRPFVRGISEQQLLLRTFPRGTTANEAYDASVQQLKQLITKYRSEYSSSNYSIVWQTSLMYTANAMLRSTDSDRITYFLICIYSYQGMRQSFRVTESIVRALLSMALQTGDISSSFARRILNDIRERAPRDEDVDSEGIRATFMADLDQSMSDPESSTAENLAAGFEENAMMTEYTSLFDTQQD